MHRVQADPFRVVVSNPAGVGRSGPSLLAAGVVAATAGAGGSFDPVVAAWAGACAAFVVGVLAASVRLDVDAVEKTVLACLGWAGIVACIDRSSPLASKEALAGWVVAVAVMMVMRRAPSGSRRLALGIMSFAALLIVAGQALDAIGMRSVRSAGIFADPNIVAALLVPLIPLLWRQHAGSAWRVVAALLSGGVVATGSRAGVLALALIALIVARRGWQRWVLTVMVVAGAAVVGWRFAAHPDAFAWYRTRIWGALVRLLAMHPIVGIGPGGFPDATGVVRLAHRTGCAIHARRIGGAESMIVGWVVRTGLVGAIGALAVIAAAWKRLGAQRIWGERGFVGTLAAIGIMALFHDFFDVAIVLWWWGALLGLGAGGGVGGGAEGAHVLGDERRGRPLVARVALGVMAAALVVWGMTQPALARLVASRGDDSATVSRAVRLEPWLDTAARARVRALLDLGKWTWNDAAEARRWSDFAARVHPGSVDAWNAVGVVNARVIGDLGIWPSAVQRARDGFRMACRLEPDLPWSWVAWARLERAIGHLATARRLDQRAVLAEPNCVRAWLLLGRIDLDLGRINRARCDLEAARTARRCGRGRVLEAYDRDLMAAPPWQWQALEKAVQ